MNYVYINQAKFRYTVLDRGEEYANEGLVSISSHNGVEVNAVVHGTKAYNVKLKFKDNGLLSSAICDCPYAEGGHRCKHMAAVLFEMDKRDIVLASSSINPIRPTSIFTQKTVSNFKGSIQSLTSYTFKEFVDEAKEILRTFEDYFTPEQRLEAEEAILRESFYHGGNEANEELINVAFDMLREAEPEYRLTFSRRIYRLLTSRESRAFFLDHALSDPHYECFIQDLATSGWILSTEWQTYFDIFPGKDPFIGMSETCFEAIAKECRLSGEVLDQFVEDCIARKDAESLVAILDSSKLSPGKGMQKKIQEFYQDSGNFDGYLEYMNKSIQERRLTFIEAAEFYHSLPEDKKKAEANIIRRAFAYSNFTSDVDLLTGSPLFTPTNLSKVSLPTLLVCEAEIRAKGPSFYQKPIKKAIEKGLKKKGDYNADLAYALKLIGIYSDIPGVVDLLDNQELARDTLEDSSARAVYLSLIMKFNKTGTIRRFEPCI